ncbi:MAG: PD40 domain-containing protein [Anaerolineae bacterium]|nr:PD40 domain-containing protein [Anaerolineae bacterium]
MLLGLVARIAIIASLFMSLFAWIAPMIGRAYPAPIIAYIRRDALLDWHNLYLLDIWHGTTVRLTYFDNSNTQPTWSPDGRYLLFTAGSDFNPMTRRSLTRRIFQVNFLTYTQSPLTNNGRGVNERNPSWSSTGRVAYAVFRSGDWDIAITRPNQYQTQLVSNIGQPMNTSANEHTPRWSPDGTHIAYLVGGDFINELAVADATGNNARILTSGMRILAAEFDWSPTGTHIVFTSQRDNNIEIYTVNIANGALINLSRHAREDFYPKWSPKSDEIAFISSRNGGQHLFIMTRDGGNVRQLTYGNEIPSHINWSPDGEWLVYSSAPTIQDNRHLFIISAQGGDPRQLTFGASDDFSSTWKPR